MAEQKRQRAGRAHDVLYFHQADDPYSHLILQVLQDFSNRYDIDLKPKLVAPPPDWAAPERQQLIDWSRLDASRLAQRAGLTFEPEWKQPSQDRVEEAERLLSAGIQRDDFSETALDISTALWSGAPLPEADDLPSKTEAEAAKQAAATERDQLGHYLGATFYYEGEWYWGVDRLHFLEERLTELGAATSTTAPTPFYVPKDFELSTAKAVAQPTEIHFYLSFRSPYTCIAAERIKALADAYGAELKLRFVLPMVMRSLPVPRMKGVYIFKDVAREAQRLGMKFGKAADPVGKPVERGYAILAHAIEQGRGYEFAHSFLTGVWTEAIDAGTDKGLQKITERAGLDWATTKALIGGSNWQPIAEANRKEMTEMGIWGVPSFRVGETITWGQDRLWVIEDALRSRV